ncbi:MAG TPA: hypothetical protein PKD34_02730 [Candidatus Doudnabacteria bacterium]|nr:hypothetical protein [Candidatus Doudnabacteria bacterium]
MNNKPVIISILVISLVSLGLSVFTYQKMDGPSSDTSAKISEDVLAMLEGYQGIFLTNGQVYFGKVEDYNSDHVVLGNVYYLKDSSSADLNIVKLGDELHGPKDPMIIKQQQILFLENLKADSQVISKIKALESTISK